MDDVAVSGIARAVLDDPSAELLEWWTAKVDYDFGSPTTGGMFRLHGVGMGLGGHRSWSAFVKVVRSYRCWPALSLLPEALRDEVLASPTWRYEADVYSTGLEAALPPGLRLPRVYEVRDQGECLDLVLEDVDVDPSPWDTGRFARAARLLARLAVRLTRLDALPASASRVPGEITSLFYTSRLQVSALPALDNDDTWQHPLLASFDPHLRADLAELALRIPSILQTLRQQPQLMIHGDASPQNLLVPSTEPDTFVAIDWTLGGLAAAGDDLAQLVVGLGHAGLLAISDLAEIHDLVASAYVTGLADEGMQLDQTTVRYGMDGGLVLRSAFTALPTESLDQPLTDEVADLISSRLQLTRWLVDLGLALRSPDPYAPERSSHATDIPQ